MPITPKYAGYYIAKVGQNVVATGKTQLEVYRKAKELHPTGMVSLLYIPTKKETLTFL